MNLIAGVPLVSLFDLSDRANETLPAAISAFAERFSVTNLQSRSSPAAIIHTGRLLPLSAIAGEDSEEIPLSFGKLKIPLLTTGVPFRLALRRGATTADLEPGATSWQLDLMLGEFELELNGLKAAEYRPEQATIPRHLVPAASGANAAIVGSCAVRFDKPGPGQDVVFRFIDAVGGGDPFVPDARSGAVTNITMSPPHALIGDSNFGITIKNLIFDYASDFSPAFVLARGQSAEWIGLAIEEAAIYCPNNAIGKGGFSVSIKDLLLGDPFGLQAELEIQFGKSPLNPATFVFQQEGEPNPAGFNSGTGVLEIKADQDEAVNLTASLTVGAPPPGGVITDYKARFTFPDGRETTGDTARGAVRHNDILTITPIEVFGTDPDDQRDMPSFTVRIVASGTPAQIDATIAGASAANLVDVSGPISELNGITLNAVLNPAEAGVTFQWACAGLGIDTTGDNLVLDVPEDASGVHFIKLSRQDGAGGSTHLRIRIRDEGAGPLYFGCQAGLFKESAPTTAVAPSRVMGTYDLSKFHAEGRLTGAQAAAQFSGSALTIDAGAIAEFALEEGGVTAQSIEDRHVQILYEFDQSVPLSWLRPNPTNTDPEWQAAIPFAGAGNDVHEELLRWAANYTSDVTFLVIGRCDDVGKNDYNKTLGKARAEAVAKMMGEAKGDQAAVTKPILTFEEQTLGGLTGNQKDLIKAMAARQNFDEAKKLLWPNSGRLINTLGLTTDFPKRSPESGDRSSPPDPTREALRERFRRVDIYAFGGTATGTSVRETVKGIDPRTRQLLAPAPGRDTLPADNANAAEDYRVLLRFLWDKPRWDGPATLIPNLAEFEYAWTPSPSDGISTTSEVLTVFGKYVYDELTGFTEFNAGIQSEGDPDGLFDFDQPNLVALFTVGPMLLSGVDFDTNGVESGVRLAALGLITGFATADLGGGPLVGDGSKSAFTKLQAKARTRAISNPLDSYKVEILTDYTNTVHVNTGALGLKTDPNQPMKIKYTDVGVYFDNTDPSAPLIDKIGVSYASDSMSVEDSGLWIIEGPLGKLLRITEFKMGTGSFWVEPTLALGIDIGVVEVTEAAFRVTFNVDDDGKLDGSPEFALKGLKASVDIPAVVSGEGRIRIESGGILRAGVDATLVPLQASASVALAIGIPTDPPDFAPSLFLSLYGRVQFPGGIPLGQLPFAIHGFIGQVTINGARALEDTEDVVAREIGWWRKDPELKYDPKKGQYAFGMGVVVGTLPDASFSFSATGMVVVAFPDVEVILGVEVEILSIPDTTAKDKKEGETAAITGLIVVNTEAVTVAVSASYEIPKLLNVVVPFGAHFPFSGASYVRIGSDNGPGRTGEPVTLTILPDTLDLKAWCFLMVEGGGLLSFGPAQDWDFHGFALGFGAGVDFSWEAGPFELSLNGAIFAGLGTAPLTIKAGLYLRGNLDLVVVSASVSGDVEVCYIDPPDGPADAAIENATFCAKVDLFFFSIEECVTIDFGSISGFTPPPPPPPVKSLSLTDWCNAITGEATEGAPAARAIYDFVVEDGVTRNEGAKPEDNHTVWPDTVPVLNFGHAVVDAISGQFDPIAQPSGEVWFGSNRLRYAYRINKVELLRDSDGLPVTDPDGSPLRSVWTHPPSRPADDSSTLPPSQAEVSSLRLLDRDPAAWAQSTADGGAGQPGDPAQIIRRICEEGAPPARACLRGQDSARLSSTKTKLLRPSAAPGPYPSGFVGEAQSFARFGTNELSGTELAAIVAQMGGVIEPGAYHSVPATALDTGVATFGYRLPHMRTIDPSDGGAYAQIPWRIELDRAVRDGVLALMVCEPRAPGPGKGCYEFADQKIGHRAVVMDLPPFVVRAVPNQLRLNELEISDSVQAIGQGAYRPGVDRRPELTIFNPGADFLFKRPCHALELHLWLPSSGSLVAHMLHGDGSTTKQELEVRSAQTTTLTLTSGPGITQVRLALERFKQVTLIKACCTKPGEVPPEPQRDCIDFNGLNQDLLKDRSFQLDGAQFTALKPDTRMGAADVVDASATPQRSGQDGQLDLRFPSAGIEVKLPAACRQLEVSLLAVSEVEITAFAANGAQVDQATTVASNTFGQTFTLSGAPDPITRIELTGGGGESFVYAICCVSQPAGGIEGNRRCWDLDDLPKNLAGQSQIIIDGLNIQSRAGQLPLNDRLTTVGTPRQGGDGRLELTVPRGGIVITLPGSCTDIDLHMLLEGNEELKVTGLDADGDPVAQASEQSRNQIDIIRLVSSAPMTRILIEGGAGEAVLWRLCCRSGKLSTAHNTCVAMEGIETEKKVSEIEVNGLILRDITDKKQLIGKKAERGLPATLSFGGGLRIDLPRTASFVRLQVITKKGAAYRAIAQTPGGKEIAGEGGTSASDKLNITLRAKDISRVVFEIEGGGELVDICLRETGQTDRRATPARRTAPTSLEDLQTSRWPKVTGIADDAQTADWTPERISSHPNEKGGTCHILRYTAPASGPRSIRDIEVEPSKAGPREVTFIGLCAVDDKAAEWHAIDEVVKDELRDDLNDRDVLAGRAIVLDPGTTYRVEVTWDYQIFQSESETEQPPVNPDPNAWVAGGVQVLRFATAPENTALPAREDGPNEHVFDPRDLDRYLLDSNPVNGARFHFTDDPVVFHFKHDHVSNLIDRYNRDWDIEVRRTDPGPKTGGMPGRAETPLVGALQTLLVPVQFLSPVEANIHDAATEAPCIESERVVGGTSLAGTFPLEPNVMYDANLWAVDKTDSADRAQVSAANFRTSRYANPEEMVQALGMDTSGGNTPSPIDELILGSGVSLPTDVVLASDLAFDATLKSVGLDTLGLPPGDAARLLAIWQPVGADMVLQAILVDALEPLNRTGHVIRGNTVAVVDRVRLEEGFIGTQRLEVRRTNLNATRALLMPTNPLPADWSADSFHMRFVADGTDVIGRRYLRTRPLVLELEGF